MYKRQDSNSPESLKDIVKLLNLKHAKKISIYSRGKGERFFLGEIFLNKEGKCLKKRSYDRNNTSHTYDINGNLIKDVFFDSDSTRFYHKEYKYDNKGHLTEIIEKDKLGLIIKREKDTLNLMTAFITLVRPIPRYKDDSGNYTYNALGYITKYFEEGFYLPSSKSREEEEYKNNTIEYRFEYNKDNQIVKYYRKLTRKTTMSEVTTEFNYVNDHIIKVESNFVGCRGGLDIDSGLNFYDKLIYKIKYY